MVVTEDNPYTKFLKLSDRERTNKVYNVFDFFVAGEEQNKRLLFYLLLSSYHPELLSFIIYRGDSSAGKNHVINSVLKVFPKEHVMLFDSATPAALRNEDLLPIKIIYLRELVEDTSIQEFLKMAWSEDGFIHKVSIMDPQTKEWKAKTITSDRKAIITTLSFEKVQVDLINRSWVLNPDQTYEQTSKVIEYQIEAEKNLIMREIERKEILGDCDFIGTCIKNLDFSYDVYIAYVDRLRALFPSDYLNVRRDINKLISLIKIITIWNQKNRREVNIGDKKYLFAEYFDLKEALEISQNLYINLVLHIDEIKKSILDFMDYVELKDLTPKNEKFVASLQPPKVNISEIDKWYSISEIYEELRHNISVSRKTAMRKMEDLFFEGYLFRDKIKGKWMYRKLKDYDLIKQIQLDNLMEEILADVERQYIYFQGKTEELLRND